MAKGGTSAGRPKGGEDRDVAPPSAAAGAAPAGAPGGGKRPSGLSMLLLHLHPRTVPEDALALRRTFALGGVAVVLLVLLLASGALLLLRYDASPELAHASVREIADGVPFGGLVRNVHHWAANGFLLVAFLHLLRVFYTGAHHPPRRANWIVGLALLLLAVAASFTGYLLPWDQLAFWAVTIATGMLEYVPVIGGTLLRAARGGAEVGSRTLAQYFVLHVAIVPILLLLLTSWHFWLVRKGGGVMLPSRSGDGAPRRAMVPTSPHLVLREGVAALVAIAAVLLLAAVVDAPLLAQANPGMSPNPAKAPWYFMGLQELLVHLHPSFAVLVVPLLAAAALVALPYLGYGEAPTGEYFHSRTGARSAGAAALAALVLTPLWVLVDEGVRQSPSRLPFLPPAVRAGLLPVLAGLLVLAATYSLARRALAATRLEAAQATFTFVVVAFVVLTVVGTAFRGAGMTLVLPWAAAGAP